MSLFVPLDSTFKNNLSLRGSKARYWQLIIDPNGTPQDLTSYIHQNSLKGGFTGEYSKWTATLDNHDEIFSEGNYANQEVVIKAAVEGASYQAVFTGYVSDSGLTRERGRPGAGLCSIQMHDLIKTRGTRRKPDSAIWAGFTISDSSSPSTSIVHSLAAYLGLDSADVDVGVINQILSVVEVGKNTAWKDLKELAEMYLAYLYLRYDGKLRFISRYISGYSTPTAEWVFCADPSRAEAVGESRVYGKVSRGRNAVTCNKASCEYTSYEQLSSRVIFKNLDNYDSITDRISIEVASGEYYPGGSSGTDKAVLNYKDPTSGEKYNVATDIQTPTIGATGDGTDIECTGGTLSLVSFNGSTSATEQQAGASELILRNNTGATITITKLQVRGKPYSETSNVVKDIDPSVADDVDLVETSLKGRFATNYDHVSAVLQAKVEYGKERRRTFSFKSDWCPGLQFGAVVNYIDTDGVTYTCTVASYTHQKWDDTNIQTQVKLLEFGEPVASRTPILAITQSPDALKQALENRPESNNLQGVVSSGPISSSNFDAEAKTGYSFTHEGVIYAYSAVLENITANSMDFESGTIGGLDVEETKMYYGSGDYGETNTPFYVDQVGKFSLSNKFLWDGLDTLKAGCLTVDSDEVFVYTGVGTAAWKDSDTPLYVNDSGEFSLGDGLFWDPVAEQLSITKAMIGVLTLDSDGSLTAPYFSVDADGRMSATELNISGTINSADGAIANWLITTDLLRSAASGKRAEIRSDELQFNIFDSSDTRKITLGYLGGVPGYGDTCYGLYIAPGNQVSISSQVDLVNESIVAKNGLFVVDDGGSPATTLIQIGDVSGEVGVHLTRGQYLDDYLRLGTPGGSQNTLIELGTVNGYEAEIHFKEGLTYGMGLRYNADDNALYIDQYAASGTPTPLVTFYRDSDQVYIHGGLSVDDPVIFYDKIGIGTSSPDAKLEVEGGGVYITGESGITVPTTNAGLYLHYNSSTGDALARSYNYGSSLWRDFYIDGGNLYLNSVSDGNVGIGTDTPNCALEVYREFMVSDVFYTKYYVGHTSWSWYSTSSTYVLIAERGQNIQIAGTFYFNRGGSVSYPRGGSITINIDDSDTYTPTYTLNNVEGSGWSGIELAKVTYNSTDYWALYFPIGIAWHSNIVSFVGHMRGLTALTWNAQQATSVSITAEKKPQTVYSGNDVLLALNGGKVGINKTSPSYALDVVGSGRIDVSDGYDFMIYDSSQGSVTNVIWYDHSAGTVMLGNTGAASYEVEVRGSLDINEDLLVGGDISGVEKLTTDQISIGGIVIEESSHRGGLIEFNYDTNDYAGILIKRSDTAQWSVMGKETLFGLYDDIGSKWILQYNSDTDKTLLDNDTTVDGKLRVDSLSWGGDEVDYILTGRVTVTGNAYYQITTDYYRMNANWDTATYSNYYAPYVYTTNAAGPTRLYNAQGTTRIAVYEGVRVA